MSDLSLWDILTSPIESQDFRLFLEKRHCEENLLFYIDAQQFLFSHSSISSDTLQAQANLIFQKYFIDSSRFCLNVDSSHIKQIKRNLESNLTRSIFIEAQQACLVLLKNDSVPKYLKSKQESSLSNSEIKRKKKSDKRSLQMLTNLRDSLEDDLLDKITEINIDEEAIVEFISPDINNIYKEVENQKKEDEDWIKQIEILLETSNTSLQSQISELSLNTKIQKEITNDTVFQLQIESISLLLSSDYYRNIKGLIHLFGEKWLKWNKYSIEQLEKESELYPNCNVDFYNLNSILQTSLMQVFETIRLIIEKYQEEFEYSTDFIIFLTKVFCKNLPGVSFIPVLNENNEEIEIPLFTNLYNFGEFIQSNRFLYNSLYTYDNDNENTCKTNTILSLSWNENDFNHINSIYQHWNTSISSFLLQEVIRIEKERLSLSELVLKIYNILKERNVFSSTILKFINTLEDITDTCIEKPIQSEQELSKSKRKRSKSSIKSDTTSPNPIRPLLKSKSKGIIRRHTSSNHY